MLDYIFTHNSRKISVQFIYPPIPMRNMDWQAIWDDGDEYGPSGHGSTAVEAVEEFLMNLED